MLDATLDHLFAQERKRIPFQNALLFLLCVLFRFLLKLKLEKIYLLKLLVAY